MINIIGLGLYGYMSGSGPGGSGNIKKSIPGRLIVTSASDVWVVSGEEAITGFKGHKLAVSAEGDCLVVSSNGEPTVEDNVFGLRVTGTREHSVYADDYLISRKDLYGEFTDDGLMIHYAGEAEFSLEKIKIGG